MTLTSEQIQEMNRQEAERSRQYAAKRFGIKLQDVCWYNGGICYDRVIVRTKTAAKKVAKLVEGEFANGGYFDGMPLGGIRETTHDGKKAYDVTC